MADATAEHPGHLGRRHRDHNLSCYSDGLMGYRTPNIDRIADEGMRFTDSYGEQSCTAGRSSFITGQSVLPHRAEQGRDARASTSGLQAEDPTIARAAQAARLRDGPVRQEPPRRPEQVPADRARLRRVLRQPLPPQRRGGAGVAQLAVGGGVPAVQRALRAARRAALVGDGRGRRDRGPALRARRAPADRGHRPADQEADGDDRRRGARARARLHRPPGTRPSTPFFVLVQHHAHALPHAPEARERRAGRALAVAVPRHDDRPRQASSARCWTSSTSSAWPRTRSSSTAPTTGRT